MSRARKIMAVNGAAGMFFAPGLFLVYWHLRYGNAIVQMGKRVPVPWHRYAEIDFHTVRLRKLPITIPPIFLDDRPVPSWGWLEPIPFSKPSEAAARYKTEEGLFWRLQERTDRVVSDPIRMGSGESEVFCMRASSKAGQWSSMASCLMFQGTWRADFLGKESDIDSFVRVVRDTQLVDTRR